MSKFERLRNSWHLTIDKVTNEWHKPIYGVLVQNHDSITAESEKKPFDGCAFTEEAWADLEEYFRSQRSGIIWRPFSEQEIEEAWIPRFSGMNPEYIKFARWAWDAAFEYVNDQIIKNRQQEEVK